MRALQTQQLKAHRDNTGNWQIGPADLDDWASMRRTPDRQSPITLSDTPRNPPADTMRPGSQEAEKRAGEAEARAAAAEARADTLADQVSDLRTERDRLLSVIERQSEARPATLWTRLFGR